MSKNTLLKPDENFDGLPPWMATMRKVVTDCVSESDVKEIVQNQVKLAKAGNKDAIKFVFGQLLGGESFRGATFVQNNYHGPARGGGALKSKPGSPERIAELERRAQSRQPLHDVHDAGFDEERSA